MTFFLIFLWVWLSGAIACLAGVHDHLKGKSGAMLVIAAWPLLISWGVAEGIRELFKEEKQAK